MKPQGFKQLSARLDALSLRERVLVMLAAFAVIYLVWDTFLMQPINRRQAAVQAEVAQTQARITELGETVQKLATSSSSNPNARLQTEKEHLERENGVLDEALAERTANIVAPREMARVLEAVLVKQAGLTLIEMRSLPAQPLFPAPETDEAPAEGNVYRHGLELHLEGGYVDVLTYLQALEALPWTFFWDSIELESVKYPRNRVKIVVYTLSLSEDWIGV